LKFSVLRSENLTLAWVHRYQSNLEKNQKSEVRIFFTVIWSLKFVIFAIYIQKKFVTTRKDGIEFFRLCWLRPDPTKWRLIEVLEKDQHITETEINQLIAGQQRHAKKKKYHDGARRIENIVSTHDKRDLD